MQTASLRPYISELAEARDTIVTAWLEYQEVHSLFNYRGINPHTFKTRFAETLFDDYLAMMEGDAEAGTTPFSGACLDYLNHQHVTPDELYTLATHLRKSLLSYLFGRGIATQECVDELNAIADTAIKNLLRQFYRVYAEDKEGLQQRQRSLLEAQQLAKIGHWELDLRSDYLYWSDEVYRIFGLSPDAFNATYEAFLERIHPDDIAMVNKAYSDSVRNRSNYHIIHRILTLDGELKYVEEHCFHNFDKEGNVYRSVGTVHDITDTILAQQELKLASQLFQHSSDAVVITDAQNNIVMVNDTFSKRTGYTIEEVKGKNPRLFSAGWGDDAFYAKMWSEIEKHGVWQGEVWDRNKSGEVYAAYLSILCVRDEAGEVLNYIGISYDVTQKKAQEEQITQLAYYDALTGLPNRVLFRQEVEVFIKSSGFERSKFALLFLDVDDFKWLNDSLGHDMGNKALIEITERIKSVLDDDTLFCRIGGDEFAICHPYHNTLDLSQLAQKIIQCVQAPIALDKEEVVLGISIGISLFPENGAQYGTLLQTADTAMYQAKGHGKNQFVYFSPEMNAHAVQRLNIDTQLRQAPHNGSLSMVYQPKVSLTSKKVYGMEALLRWNDPKLGFISPELFIPIAEESRLIEEIGYWVIRRSLEEFSEILAQSRCELRLSINVSGKQLNDTGFVPKASALIADSGVAPENLEFEITETAIIENIEVIAQTLEAIRALGISISIDDFGTGYSSMAYLKKLPIHTIKIDRAFVKDIDSEEDDRAITEAIVAMSRQLRLKTIAEGVETQEHERLLSAMGVDNGQGYLYSRPLERDAFIAFIRERCE